MALGANVEPAVLALQPGEYWPLQELTGPIFDAGLLPKPPTIGTPVTFGIPIGMSWGTGLYFNRAAGSHLSAAFSYGATLPQAVFVVFQIQTLATQDQMLFYIGSNNTGDGWGIAFNHAGNGHLWLLRGGIAWTDLGLNVANLTHHTLYAGYTTGWNLGVTLDGVYGYSGVLVPNAPSQHMYLAWDGWTGGNNHADATFAHFAYFWGNIPGTPATNTIVQAGSGLPSQSLAASQADLALTQTLLNTKLDAILASVRKTY